MNRFNSNALDRFKHAQNESCAYDLYIQEARKKQSHISWEWYVFPCLNTKPQLFHTDIHFIQNKREALLYWQDPILKQRLYNITSTILGQETHDAFDIFGSPDYMFVHSCMTLFYIVSRDDVFKTVLNKFYGGVLCEYTTRYMKPRWQQAKDFLMRKI